MMAYMLDERHTINRSGEKKVHFQSFFDQEKHKSKKLGHKKDFFLC